MPHQIRPTLRHSDTPTLRHSAAPKLAFGLKLGYRKNVKSVSLREVDSGER